LRRTPAAIAAVVLPPASSTASAPNWAAPEKTTIDMTIGANGPMSGRASTPNETEIANTAIPNGKPRRIPALRRSTEASSTQGVNEGAGALFRCYPPAIQLTSGIAISLSESPPCWPWKRCSKRPGSSQ
jgi:hypothetical protein